MNHIFFTIFTIFSISWKFYFFFEIFSHLLEFFYFLEILLFLKFFQLLWNSSFFRMFSFFFFKFLYMYFKFVQFFHITSYMNMYDYEWILATDDNKTLPTAHVKSNFGLICTRGGKSPRNSSANLLISHHRWHKPIIKRMHTIFRTSRPCLRIY